jgi:hypothetical protein
LEILRRTLRKHHRALHHLCPSTSRWSLGRKTEARAICLVMRSTISDIFQKAYKRPITSYWCWTTICMLMDKTINFSCEAKKNPITSRDSQFEPTHKLHPALALRWSPLASRGQLWIWELDRHLHDYACYVVSPMSRV